MQVQAPQGDSKRTGGRRERPARGPCREGAWGTGLLPGYDSKCPPTRAARVPSRARPGPAREERRAASGVRSARVATSGRSASRGLRGRRSGADSRRSSRTIDGRVMRSRWIVSQRAEARSRMLGVAGLHGALQGRQRHTPERLERLGRRGPLSRLGRAQLGDQRSRVGFRGAAGAAASATNRTSGTIDMAGLRPGSGHGDVAEIERNLHRRLDEWVIAQFGGDGCLRGPRRGAGDRSRRGRGDQLVTVAVGAPPL